MAANESERLPMKPPLYGRESFLAAVREGLADAEAGLLFEDEEVERILTEEYPPED
jgi:predicted transcriptional regulator